MLNRHVELFERTAQAVAAREPRASVEVQVRRQYRNMRRYIDAVPEIITVAEAGDPGRGRSSPSAPLIRGGTDGSRLSEMGLPTPNLFTGGHEFHSVREWASVNDMATAAATIVRLAEAWTRVGD